MDLNCEINISHSCGKYGSRWPYFDTDLGYYPRCIHWPGFIPTPPIGAEIWSLTANLTKVIHVENIGLGDLILVQKLVIPKTPPLTSCHPSTTYRGLDMDLDPKLNLSHSCRKYGSRWPYFGTDVGYYPRCIYWPCVIPPPLIGGWDMDLNQILNLSHSCGKYGSRWPYFGTVVDKYPRRIHWPNFSPLWLIVAEMWIIIWKDYNRTNEWMNKRLYPLPNFVGRGDN